MATTKRTQDGLLAQNDLTSGIVSGLDLSSSTGGQAPAPQSTNELDTWLDRWQTQSAATIQSDSDGDLFTAEDQAERVEDITDAVSPGELPAPPSLTDEMARMRGEYNVDQMEQEMNYLKRLEREQQAIRRERLSGTFQERTRASAVQGQVTEIERQEAERIDAINREIAYIGDQINTAYNAINTVIQVLNMDWQNAKAWWETKFNANMAVYQQARAEFESDRTFEENKRQFEITQATASLQIYIDLITSGNLFWDTMDAATRTEITKLEIQSGLGKGFISKLQMNPGDMVQSITTRIVGNQQYADVVTINPKTGKVEKETILLGAVSPTGGYSGDGGGGGEESDGVPPEAAINAMVGKLSAKVGGDGKVSPNTWNFYRNQWLQAGYSAKDFFENFKRFVNNRHALKHGGYEGLPHATSPTAERTYDK